MRYLIDPDLYPVQHNCVVNFPKSTLKNVEFSTLIYNGLVEKSVEQNGQFGYVFSVPEPEKNRKRIVHDALSANVLCREPWKIRFSSMQTLQKVVHTGDWSATFDIKCMYYHFKLDRAVAKQFPIQSDSGDFFQLLSASHGVQVGLQHCSSCNDLSYQKHQMPHRDLYR